MEQTFFIIKPDGVKRGLVGEVLKRIEQRGFTIEKLEFRSQVSEELIDQHYQDLVGQSFYLPIREFMTSGPVLVGVISGPKVIETWRTMMGATRPEESLPGTIRDQALFEVTLQKLLEKMRLSKMLYMVQIQKSQLSEKLLFGFKSGLAQSIG